MAGVQSAFVVVVVVDYFDLSAAPSCTLDDEQLFALS